MHVKKLIFSLRTIFGGTFNREKGKRLNFVGYFITGILCDIISFVISIFQEMNIPCLQIKKLKPREVKKKKKIVHNHIANK